MINDTVTNAILNVSNICWNFEDAERGPSTLSKNL